MSQADLIWMNGELVAYEDAKVHVLTHALHYGTGVFEGVRAYETPRGTGDLPPRRPHRPAVPVGRLYHMEIPYSKEELRAATHETITRNGLKSCYIRPLVFRGAGPDGPVPARLPGRGHDRGLGVGRLPRRRGQAERHPRQGLLVAAHRARRADPGRQGHGPVPQLRAGQDRGRQGRLRGGHPARPARHGLRGHGREPVRRQGRHDPHAGLHELESSAASTACRRSRSPATSATRSSSATSPAASSTWPTRSS